MEVGALMYCAVTFDPKLRDTRCMYDWITRMVGANGDVMAKEWIDTLDAKCVDGVLPCNVKEPRGRKRKLGVENTSLTSRARMIERNVDNSTSLLALATEDRDDLDRDGVVFVGLRSLEEKNLKLMESVICIDDDSVTVLSSEN